MMITVPTHLADIFGNLARVYALTQFPSWRPFAYRFESRASVLSTDLFTDRPLDIHTELSSLTYEDTTGHSTIGEIREESYNITNQLSLSELTAQSKFKITGEMNVIAQAMTANKLTVYFLYQKGWTTEENNRNLIPVDANTVVLASRHSLNDNLGFKAEKVDNENSKLTFFGCDSRFISDALEQISNIYKAMP